MRFHFSTLCSDSQYFGLPTQPQTLRAIDEIQAIQSCARPGILKTKQIILVKCEWLGFVTLSSDIDQKWPMI